MQDAGIHLWPPFDPQALIVCRVIEEKQVQSVHSARKETVSLDPW